MNCILRKKSEDDNQVTYLFYPNNTGVPDEPGILSLDKKEKKGKLIKTPKADEGSKVSLYTGLAFAVAYRFLEAESYPEMKEGAW